MHHFCCILAIFFLATLPVAATAQTFDIESSTYLGGPGEDRIQGVRIQRDGTIVLAATLSAKPPGAAPTTRLGGATEASQGAVLRVSPDGKKLLSVTYVAEEVLDLALGPQDEIVVAAGADGVVALGAKAKEIVWQEKVKDVVHRVDVSSGGVVAALTTSNPKDAQSSAGSGRVHLFSLTGMPMVDFAGWRNTQDVCVDQASKSVTLIGWRQASAFDGKSSKPVQIAYLRSVDFEGKTRWTLYDWSTDRGAQDFLNRPENNMADTRGYRCSLGEDGKLYAGFEAAGGNHIFRYSPTDLSKKVQIVGGDAYHQFFNSRAEHKLFFARFDPDTGDYLLGQQFAGRLGSGRANAVRMRGGELRADAQGRVLVTGAAASGLPIDTLPPGTGSYTGGAYLLFMSADFSKRLFINRPSASATGHGADLRTFEPGRPNIVQVGSTETEKEMLLKDAIQQTFGGGKTDGFLTVLNGVVPPGWDPDAPTQPPTDMGFTAGMDMSPTPPADMGTGPTVDDMGQTTQPDSGTPGLPPAQDAGNTSEMDPVSFGKEPDSSPEESGCGCTSSGTRRLDPAALLLGVFGLLGVCCRRRFRSH